MRRPIAVGVVGGLVLAAILLVLYALAGPVAFLEASVMLLEEGLR